MHLTIEIECGNAAFDDGNARHELARILREQADKLDEAIGGTSHAIEYEVDDTSSLYDVNGNNVGSITLEHD